jgi:lipoprotein signal peptidase
MQLPLFRLFRVAGLVALGDLATKFVAAKLWSTAAWSATSWLSLYVVHNTSGAFGWTAGDYTRPLNLLLTLATILVIVPVTRDLSAVDRHAPIGLGLIVGGAFGNLVSLIFPPAGVADFIALHWSPNHGTVLNVADLAAYTGLAMTLATAGKIGLALWHRRTTGAVLVADVPSRVRTEVIRVPARVPSLAADQVVTDWSRIDTPPVEVADLPAARRRPGSRTDEKIRRPLGVEGERPKKPLVFREERRQIEGR